MDDLLSHKAFAKYAYAQAARGQLLLREHRRGPADSCRECAHLHPCAQRRRGAELILHFGHWNAQR